MVGGGADGGAGEVVVILRPAHLMRPPSSIFFEVTSKEKCCAAESAAGVISSTGPSGALPGTPISLSMESALSNVFEAIRSTGECVKRLRSSELKRRTTS